ncbi:hypothetical protein HANVADRAFT_40394 [Hanseniaspora valbyensis NRRL Y-1626]|uniref:Bicarbonate transporter-like transmembrane domain-containing protein n=1 Tax=Hanseniaspora valbyensis NRRL Y-1626 TaxID=766949 RepID=A0A1B7TCG6_9ASCO|nr:hypothetical protein HANVADRAFT_40394 [Hanseniaspora valbyensis NRRL Y-1626]
MIKPFVGIRRDWKDRLTKKTYLSDWRDAWNYRVLPSTIETFLNNLLPAIAFSQDLFNRTNHNYGLNEILLSQGISGLLFGILGYPLSIVGVSAPSCIICYTIFGIFMDTNSKREINVPKEKFNDGFNFFGFMFWVYLWTGIITIFTSIMNVVCFFQFVTNFPCDIFGCFINVVYIVKGCELLGLSFKGNATIEDVAAGFANITIALCMTIFGVLTKRINETRLFTHDIRIFIRDYSTILSVIFWSGVTHFGNAFKYVKFEKLDISKSFQPSYVGRTSWLAVDNHLPAKYVFLAIPFGIILWILLFFDHNISSLMAQKTEYKLSKKSMYHWDFCLLSVHTILCGVLGLPAGHCLIPQSDKDDNNNNKVPSKNMYISGVVEQRLTNSLQGLMMIICMCRPFLVCLNQIPQCILSALFFILGINGLLGNTNIQRLIYLVSDVKEGPLKQVSVKKLICFLIITYIFAAGEILVSQLENVSIGFPLVLLLSILVTFGFPNFFNKEELNILDSNVVTKESIKNLLSEKSSNVINNN